MAQIKIKVNDADKERAEEALKEMGLTLSAAIRMFIAMVGRERRIPFEVSQDPFCSDANMERLIRSAKEIDTTGGTVHDLSELETKAV